MITLSLRGLLFLAVAFCAGGALGRPGAVETVDRRAYEGRIRLDSDVLVVANFQKDVLVEIPATNLYLVTFGTEPAAEPTDPTEEAPKPPPSPWQDEDIGKANLAGNTTWRAGRFQIKNSGTNLLGEADSFHFVYKEVSGNSELMARVLAVDYTSAWAKAGVMMRENLNPEARNVFMGLTAGQGGVMQWRASYRGDTMLVPARDVSLPHWVKLKRDGDFFSAYISRGGRYWRKVDTVKLSLPADIFVGLAVSGNQPQVLNTSTMDVVQEAPVLTSHPFVPQIILRSGSVLPGHIEMADDQRIRFSGPLPAAPVPTSGVAHILFQWMPFRFGARLKAGRPGVILSTGEFIEGDIKSIARGQVTISSVLFGLRTYDLSSEIMAAILHPPDATKPAWEIRTTDGALWRASGLSIGKNELLFQEPSLGLQHVPTFRLKEIWKR